MNKNVAFTICAKNYIGLAQVLEKSIKEHNENVDFCIFVADEFIESDELLIGDNLTRPDNILIAKDVLALSDEKWNELSFKYNLTEFCTSIKSMCFSYLFEERDYEKVIFLDPDILVFNTLDSIFEHLNAYSIILTPHVLNLTSTSRKLRDNDMMNTGVFNLGFIALKGNEISYKMLKWWNERLMDYCYIDYYDGYFTDQKWMNFIPAYFTQNEVLISSHLGMNVAPWNFEERELLLKEGVYYICDRLNGNNLYPLLFTHYSGFDYSGLITGIVRHTTIQDLKIFDDLVPLFKEYEKVLQESDFEKYLKMKYLYGYYDNLCPITNVHRRLYRRLLNDNKIKFNPFKTNKDSFFDLLKKQKMISHKLIQVDKANRFNTPNLNVKIKFINNLLKIVYKILGYQRYFVLIKLLREYSKLENHIYLIDKSYMEKNIFSEK